MRDIFNKFIDYIRYEKKYSDFTVKNYERDLDYFLEFLNGKKINSYKNVDYDVIREYLLHLHNHNYSKKTIARYISSIRTFFKYLYNEELITNNPAILVSNPKMDKKLPNYLFTNDLENLLDSASGEDKLEIRDCLILELLYSTGIRVSELVNIKIKDINYGQKTIKIHGKGNKERFVIYGNVCSHKLTNYLKNSRNLLDLGLCDNLILNSKGNKITTRMVENIVKKYQLKSSVGINVSPHTLRHTFATHMLDSGADLKTVQELMGHSSLSSTQVYTHMTNERLRNVYLHTHPRAK